MKFILLFIFIFSYNVQACSLCATDIPQVFVDVEISSKKEKTLFSIKWKFQKEFVNSLTQYDINENGIFDKNEQVMIEESLVDYLKKFHYLTDIYYKNINKHTKNKYITTINPTFSNFTIINQEIIYQYKFELPFTLENRHKLYIGFSDEGDNFNFHLENIVLKNYPLSFKKEKSLFHSIFIFNDSATTTQSKKEVQKSTKEKILPKNTNSTYLEYLIKEFNELKKTLQTLLKDIKETNNIFSFLWLLLFSFLYGVLHAIGPGHGKSLVSSYFLNQDKSYIKAFNISLLIGVVHTFSAFLLTLVIYQSISFVFNSTLNNVEQISSKISAIIIILIALYLLYKKFKSNNKIVTFSIIKDKPSLMTPNVTHTKTLSCGCNSCKTTSTDLGVILAAGIIPCPGTVTIFLFTMGLGIYFVGFMSAVFMSWGMSLIIFITAIISVKIRKSTNKYVLLQKTLEYGSLLFILFLGLFLLILS